MFDYTLSPAEGGVEFKGWPKTPRDRGNNITITEKIDGTNACVIVRDGEVVGFQSRTRLIKPGDDNMGFASWGFEHREELAQLGDGYHYGEWAGPGIQNNPHMLTEKQFFLFDTFRPAESLPECIKQVAVLYNGPSSAEVIDQVMADLWVSAGEQGYIPEGIVIYNHNSRSRMKKTFANTNGKWRNA
jgi:hypothetical protein